MLFLRIPSVRSEFRRKCSSSSPGSSSILNRMKDFVFSTEKENFHADFVQRAHNWDKISRKDWKLIYRDIGASRSFFLVSASVPLSLVGSTFLAYDYFTNPPSRRSSILKRLEKDANQLGVLIIFPAIAICAVVFALLRVHSCRVLRIYQNRKDVDTFAAVHSQFVVKQKKMIFNRDSSSAFYYDEDREVLKLVLNFLFGNIQVGRRKMFCLDECFLGNNYRSYMLNETSVPPRLNSPRNKIL